MTTRRAVIKSTLRSTFNSSRQMIENRFPWHLRLLLRGGGVRLDRPCLVLGSAPNPHLPTISNYDLICVNSSGLIAKELGLGKPKLTVMGGFKLVHPNLEEDRKVLHGLSTEYLILIRHTLPIPRVEAEKLLAALNYHYQQFLTVDFWDRACMIRKVTGKRLGGEDTPNASRQGTPNMASNGIFAACYALYHGAPEIILSGISLTKDGHYYSEQNRRRRHTSFDLTAIKSMVERGWPVKTSEPELAELTGLPLV